MEYLLNLLAVEEATGGEPTSDVTVNETPTDVTETTTEPTTEPTVPSSYNIDGQDYTLDEIREWRRSGLRQADYTKKTQEVARQRKEAEEALEVYNYLMSNQELVQKLIEFDSSNPVQASNVKGKLDPVQREIQELKTQLKVKDIDAELNEITSKDKMVNDVELLEIATKTNCDINTAYNIWRGNNLDKILAEREKELTQKIKSEIEKNQTVTKTLISNGDVAPTVKDYGLSDVEKAFAQRLGMTEEEYSIYKNPNYKMK